MPTSRRKHRIGEALHQRQLDIVIALDLIHDQHNLSAVLRTADASGFGRVIWAPDFNKPEDINPEVSKGSERWVDLKVVDDIKPSLLELRRQGYKIAATHMAREAVDFRTIDWTQPWVVVFGNEHRGCSDATVELADANIFLPMAGFVQSLNISVAAAVTLYEIQRQRQQAGMYSKTATKEQVELLYNQWNLADEELTIDELLTRPEGPLPAAENSHTDGRYNCPFLQKKHKKQCTLNSGD